MATNDSYDTGDILYECDLKASREAAEGHGVLSGLSVTQRGAGANMSVDVAAGYCIAGDGTLESEAATTNLPINNGDASNDRIDLIVYDTSGNEPLVVEGTASANPNPPDRADANDVILARVHVPANESTSIEDSDIYDCRGFVYGNQAVHTASDWKWNNSADIYLYSDYGSTQKIKLDGGTGAGTFASGLSIGADTTASYAGQATQTFESTDDNSRIILDAFTDKYGALIFHENGTERAYIAYYPDDANKEMRITVREAGSQIEMYTADTLALTLDSSQNATFAGSVSCGTNEVTCGSINRASGTLTSEIGGVAQQSITSSETTFAGDVFIAKAGAELWLDSSDTADLKLDTGSTSYDPNIKFYAAATQKAQITCDTSDANLEFYTGSGTPTLALTIDSTQGLTPVGAFVSGFWIGLVNDNYHFDDSSTGSSGSATMYIGNYSIDVSAPSDQRLKENLRFTDFSVNDLMKLNVYDYNYIEEYTTDIDVIHTGLISQEVQKIIPNIIQPFNSGCLKNKGVDDLICIKYNELIPYLVKAIQDLKSQLDSLKGTN